MLGQDPLVSLNDGDGLHAAPDLIGSLLASRKHLRVLAVDANPDFGTLASLAPESMRSPHTAADLYGQLDSVSTSAAVRAYVTVLAGGLHILAARLVRRARPGHRAARGAAKGQ